MNEKIISSLIDEIIQKIEVRPVITAATVTSSSTSTSTSLKKETRGRKPNPDKSKKNEKETHNCTECEFSTDKRLLLKKHFIAEHSDKIVEPFKCEYCEKSFKDPGQLSNHRNVHIGIKPFKCNECELCFTTKGELIRHTRYKHTLERPHKCTFCDYSSVELSKLKRHIRVHTGERPYLCPYCDYASRDTFKLKRHLRIHTGEKPYVCPVCKSSFSQSNSLKVHMQKHHPDIPSTITPSKNNSSEMTQHAVGSPGSADSSSNTFLLSSSSSSIHTITTHDESSTEPVMPQSAESSQSALAAGQSEIFECKECSMKFLSSQLLSEHSVEHTGERPYECEICGVKFTHKFALRSHKLSHDAEYSQSLKEKLKSVNRNTAIANSTMPVEIQFSQQTIYKKSIRNMMGLKEKDDTVKQTLNTIVQHQKIRNKIIQEESEKIRNAYSSAEKKNKKQVISQPESLMESIDQVAESGGVAEEAVQVKAKKNLNEIVLTDDEENSITESPVHFKVGQNKRKIQHAENSFVIMGNNNNKKQKTNETDTSNDENSVQNLTSTSKPSIVCSICNKKYVSEINLKRHIKQMHHDKNADSSSQPNKTIARDDFLSHLNATVTSRIVPVVEKTAIEPCTSTSSIDVKTADDSTNEDKLEKKARVKSIYDNIDNSQPKIPISFTPITKTSPTKGVKPKKSHLANDDSIEIIPVNAKIDKTNIKKK